MHGANAYDFAVEVTPAFDAIAAMTWCHQSQIREWIPWVGRHHLAKPPSTPEEWSRLLRQRFARQQRDLGIRGKRLAEVFSVTAWGEVPTAAQLRADLPAMLPSTSSWTRLQRRLRRWRGE
jgi:hypothetical protein